MLRPTLLAFALLATLAAGFPNAASASQSSEEMVALLNEQRRASGLPGVTHAPDLSASCDQEGVRADAHVRDWSGRRWTRTENPWTNAPLHLVGIFDPLATEAGAAQTGDTYCMRVRDGRSFDRPTFFSIPAFGAENVTAAPGGRWEIPYTPMHVLGLSGPEGGPSGPQILAWAAGADSATVIDVLITGPNGRVETRTLDSSSGRWPVSSALVIVVRRLDPLTRYTGHIRWATASGGELTQPLDFTTEGSPTYVTVGVSRRARGYRFSVRATSPRLAPPKASLTLRGPRGVVRRPRLKAGATKVLRNLRPAGRWTACGQAGGPGTTYAPAERCRSFTVR